MDHPTEEDLVMLYYREGSSELRAHLDVCPRCNTAWQNLTRVLDACDDLPVPEPHPSFESRMWHRLQPQLRPVHHRSRWLVIAAMAALVIVAFMAGRFSRPKTVVAITAEGRERLLVMALGDHLERSEIVLSELTHDEPVSALRARSLISENRLYRQTAVENGDPALAQVLDQLERVMIDVSHGGDPDEIKARIESEGLVFKLRVLECNLPKEKS